MSHRADTRDSQNKAILKALETPEEKRARRLAKKLEKDKKKKEKLGWDDEHLSYTNVDNPFGDPNLHRPFIWKKKFEKEGITDVPESKLLELNNRKLDENRLELEKVKKRRWLYEKEKEAREAEVEKMQREREAAQFKEWGKQEDKFHLEQALLRSEIRINDHRAKPIDLLAKYISEKNDELTVEMHEPYTYLNGLTISDLEDLLEDIKVYVKLEQGQNSDYWRDITIIVEDELDKLKKILAEAKDEYYSHRREGINNVVREDIAKIFKGKTYVQLELLAKQVVEKIQTQEHIDIGYWESLLKQLKAHMAKARLREKHREVLKRRLLQLKLEQGVEADTPSPLFPIPTTSSSDPKHNSSELLDPSNKASTSKEEEVEIGEEAVPTQPEEEVENEEDILAKCEDEYEEGRYSPEPIPDKYLEKGTMVVELADELKRIDFARRTYLSTGSTQDSYEDLMFKQLSEGMALDDEEFNGNLEPGDRYNSNAFSLQVNLPQQPFLWRDKYKPRKPRFFNRVHTGFEWNKYNQTHYDFDNPPPKIVQGYKFNIFYPDLINKSATPTYTVTPCYEGGVATKTAPTPDFAVLRFTAGPPYEDIAFKIVNREWECSYKKGFRCQFYNNIFQLWFHFKRYRYRR